jgi:hypothetical protein
MTRKQKYFEVIIPIEDSFRMVVKAENEDEARDLAYNCDWFSGTDKVRVDSVPGDYPQMPHGIDCLEVYETDKDDWNNAKEED